MNNCILHVEDEEADIFLLQRALKKAGVQLPLKAVTDGQAALDYLSGAEPFADRQQNPLPCLILLDLKLPKQSGFDVLKWLRQNANLRTIVVIVLSSSADPKDVDRAYELGANSFIQKPSDLEQTVRLAQVFKDWWLTYNRFPTAHECSQPLNHAA